MANPHKIVLASGNRGKIREMSELLADFHVEILPQSDFNTPEAEETGLSFVENAIIKARNACEHSGLPAIADDSGIEVDALGGAPGIHSARFAGEGANDSANNAKLIEYLANLPAAPRSARYRCCIVYLRHAADPSPVIAEGTWEGIITRVATGDGGFGYDPYFMDPELGQTAAQLDAATKNLRSHRGIAMRALLEKLKGSLTN